MSTYEANWETGFLVTAEAVFGIGAPSNDEVGKGQAIPTTQKPDRNRPESAFGEAAD